MTPPKHLPEVTVQDLHRVLESSEGSKPVLIDVREPFEREIATLGGEIIPMQQIPERFGEIPRDVPVVVYCRSGGRSGQVCEYLMAQHGFTNVSNLKGGVLAWAKEIDPTMKTY